MKTFYLILALFIPFYTAQADLFTELEKNVVQFKLKNGMQVVFYRRPNTPIFSGQLWVRVGGVDENPGNTGIAHFLEHMAFKGTKTIGTKDFSREEVLLTKLEEGIQREGNNFLKTDEAQKLEKDLQTLWVDNEFSQIYERAGGEGLNAGTAKDFTYYTVDLPNVAFELWCWMESERILNPVFRQFYKEREVVQEERRAGYDDDPGGRMYELLLQLSYVSHPNRLPVIGWPADLKHLTATDMTQFYSTYYHPERMTLSIVGDLETKQVKNYVERYFERIPGSKSAIPEVRAVEPVQSGERSGVVEFNAEAQFLMGYHKPIYPNPDDAHFAILHGILGDGRSSIFEREFVQTKKIATAIDTTEAPGERFPSLFVVAAYPARGTTAEKLRDEVQKRLDRLQTETISAELIEGTKRRVRLGQLKALESNNGLAMALGKSASFWGNWKAWPTVYRQIEETKASDIKNIVSKYLTISNRTFVKIIKK